MKLLKIILKIETIIDKEKYIVIYLNKFKIMEKDTANSQTPFVPYLRRVNDQVERVTGEDGFITLHRSIIFVHEYNSKAQMLAKIATDNNLFFPKLPNMKLNNIIIMLMPRLRWTNIIKKVFDGMEPPIQKQANTDFYLNIFIPDNQITEQQKERIIKVKPYLSSVIWYHMLPNERLWICASIQGMILTLDGLYSMM